VRRSTLERDVDHKIRRHNHWGHLSKPFWTEVPLCYDHRVIWHITSSYPHVMIKHLQWQTSPILSFLFAGTTKHVRRIFIEFEQRKSSVESNTEIERERERRRVGNKKGIFESGLSTEAMTERWRGNNWYIRNINSGLKLFFASLRVCVICEEQWHAHTRTRKTTSRIECWIRTGWGWINRMKATLTMMSIYQ